MSSHENTPTRFKVVSRRRLQALASRRRFLAGGAASMAALGLGGKSFASTSRQQQYLHAAAQEQLEIIIGTLGEAPNINPFIAQDSEENWRCVQLFDELVRVDPASYEVVPGLAKSWELEDLAITLHLNDVQFSDGTPLTAHDIKFAIEGHLRPETASPRQSNYAPIKGGAEMISGAADSAEGVIVVDDKTIRIELAKPEAALLFNLRYIRPVPSAQLEGKNLNNDPWFQAPIGAGPFVFESWDVGADFVMLRNENYFEEGKPTITKVTHRVIADGQSLVLALLNNEIDGSNYPSPTGKEQLEGNPDLEIMVPPFNSANGWMFNTRHELLGNRDVRRAIAMGLDREQFAADALLGLGKAAVGPLAPDSWAFDASVEPLPFDPEQAKSLIQGAGAEGAELSFVVNAGNIQREDWLIYSEQMLKNIGIVVKPETVEWATLVERVTVAMDFEVAGGDWAGATAEPTLLWNQFHTDGAVNRSGYSNAELDALLDQARETLDPEAAKPIYSQIQTHIVEENPFFFAWYRPFLHTINKRFANYTDSGSEGLFYTLKDWTAAD